MNISSISNSMRVNPYRSYTKTSKVTHNSMSMDKVEISDDAMELYSGNKDIRLDKVKDIKNRIAMGSYTINSTDIVDGMMRSAGLA